MALEVFVFDKYNNRYRAFTAEEVLSLIQQAIDNGSLQGVDPESCPVVRHVQESNKNSNISFWVGSEAEFNALGLENAHSVVSHVDENGKIYFSEDDDAYAELLQRMVDESRDAAETVIGDKVSKSALTVTLSASAWASNSQTVAVVGVAADPNVTSVIVASSEDSRGAYETAGVRCTAQGDDSLTFKCSKTPTADLTVNVLILR